MAFRTDGKSGGFEKNIDRLETKDSFRALFLFLQESGRSTDDTQVKVKVPNIIIELRK